MFQPPSDRSATHVVAGCGRKGNSWRGVAISRQQTRNNRQTSSPERERDRHREANLRVANIQDNFNVTQNNVEVNNMLAETRMKAGLHLMEAREGDRHELSEFCAQANQHYHMAALNIHQESCRMEAQAQHPNPV